MTWPGDELAAGVAGRGSLRASHADRERVIEVLKAAFVQGRRPKANWTNVQAMRLGSGPYFVRVTDSVGQPLSVPLCLGMLCSASGPVLPLFWLGGRG